MPRRGSLVGDAYVRIHADSSAIDDELRREMIRASKPASKAYISNLDKAIEREAKQGLKRANEAIVRGIVGGPNEWDRQFKRSGMKSVDQFARAVRSRLRQIADASDAAGKPFRGLEGAMNSIDAWARGNTETKIQRIMGLFRNGRSNVNRFSDVFGKAFGKGSRNNFLNFVGSVAGGMAQITGLFLHSGISVFTGGLKVLSTFGKGAFGILKGIGQILDGGGAGGLIGNLKEFGSNIGDLAISFGGALLSAGKAVLPVLLGIGAAISLGAVALPPLLALISNLAAIVTAVAGTISIGLVGALLAAAPLFVALAAAAVPAVIAFANLGEITKKQTKALKPFTDAWAKFKKEVRGPVTDSIIKGLATLAPLIKNDLMPLLKNLGIEVGKMIERFGKIMESPGMQRFLKVWEAILPTVFANLGGAISNFAAGLVAFFTPILPFALRLSEKIEELSQTFLIWIQSSEGQNSVADFMRTAWQAASDLWDIVVLVAQALAGIFTAGNEDAGGTIIDSIKTKLEEFVAWINSPEGAQGLKDFFTNGLETAKQLWTTVGDIARGLGAINWEDATNNINTVIDFIGDLIGWGLLLVAGWNAWTKSIGIAWSTVGSAIVGVYNAFIGPAFDKILGAIAAVLRALALMLGALGNVPGFGWAKDASKKLYDAADGADALGDSIRNIPDANVNVHVGLSGPGVALLHKAQQRKNPDVYYGLAAGGILSGPTFIRNNVIAGEAGREAVVPLDRPLSQIDPSVRALAAYAQGQTSLKSGGVAGSSGTTIEAGAIVVQAPYSDPALVAESVFDHLAAGAR